MKEPEGNAPVHEFPVLIGDIGGTNARFALLTDALSRPEPVTVVQCKSFARAENAIQEAVLDKTSVLPRSAVLAVAGPLDGEAFPVTNNDWIVQPWALMEELGLRQVTIVNDFTAQALAVVASDNTGFRTIGDGKAEAQSPRVVLGPGTGLGVAGLVCWRHRWIPIAGEGGHIDFGPQTESDRSFFPYLEKEGSRLSAEHVLCGRGLLNIHRAQCAANGTDPRFSAEQEITGAALRDDLAARQAVDTFLTLLGRFAGDLALLFMARGGVYLTGAVIGHLGRLVASGDFRAAFDDKEPHAALLRQIPVFLVTDPLTALAGLTAYVSVPSRFGDIGAFHHFTNAESG